MTDLDAVEVWIEERRKFLKEHVAADPSKVTGDVVLRSAVWELLKHQRILKDRPPAPNRMEGH